MSGARRMRVCGLEEIPLGEMKRFHLEGLEPVCVYHTEDGVYATEDLCTHALAALSDGYLEGNVIYCPFHGGAFDVATGAAVVLPCTEAVRTYPVAVSDGSIYLEIDQ